MTSQHLKTKYFELMRRYCQVGTLLPADHETFDFDDERAVADLAMVLLELGDIQREMDQVTQEARALSTQGAHT